VSAGAGVAVTVFMLVRYAVLSKYHADQFAAIPFLDNALVKADLPFASRIASAFYILGYYIRLLVVPYPLIMDYSYDHFPFVTMANPVALLSLLAYLGLIIYGLRLFLKDRRNPYAFCILYFLITLSLYSNTFMLIAATLGERFLFFPSVGFCLAVALLLERWAGNAQGETGMLKSAKVWSVMVPVGLIFAVITVNRNTEWQDNYTLFTTDVQKAPRSVKLNYLAGVELLNLAKEETNAAKQQKGSQDGIAYLNKAVAIYPDYDDAQAELCGAYYRMGRYDAAEVHGKISLKLNPANAVTLNNMGGLFFVKKDYRKTIELCEQAIHLQPGYVDMYTNVAASFLSLGVTDSGLHYLYQAIKVDPDFKTTYVFLATAYRAAGKADSARKYESIAKKLM
jgi:tetratricopeptide (TPR) repeat protein